MKNLYIVVLREYTDYQKFDNKILGYTKDRETLNTYRDNYPVTPMQQVDYVLVDELSEYVKDEDF